MFQIHSKPFLMLAGEAHNSNSSTMQAMEPVWAKAAELGMNSILLPVAWEQIEPEEGRFTHFSWWTALLQGQGSGALSWRSFGSAHGRTLSVPMPPPG